MTSLATPVRPPAARRHPGRWIACGVASVVVALAVVLALNVGTDPTAATRTSSLLGRPAPNFELPTLDGGRVTLAGLAGKSVIVNFWNTWCIPCGQELPALQEFYRLHANDSDFVMLGIVRDDTTPEVRRYVRREKIGWVVALDPGSKAALDFGTRGQPETFVLAPDGQIVGFQWGPSTVAGLEEMLTTARG